MHNLLCLLFPIQLPVLYYLRFNAALFMIPAKVSQVELKCQTCAVMWSTPAIHGRLDHTQCKTAIMKAIRSCLVIFFKLSKSMSFCFLLVLLSRLLPHIHAACKICGFPEHSVHLACKVFPTEKFQISVDLTVILCVMIMWSLTDKNICRLRQYLSQKQLLRGNMDVGTVLFKTYLHGTPFSCSHAHNYWPNA